LTDRPRVAIVRVQDGGNALARNIDILAFVTRPSFASGLGPIGDHFNLRGLAARRCDFAVRIIELNARPTSFHLDADALRIEQQGAPPITLASPALVLYMPVSFDVEETDLAPTPADERWPTFAHWQWRPITEYLEERLPLLAPCINNPRAARRANNKLLQWEALRAAGLEIPPLAVSTHWPRDGALANAPSLIRKNLSESGWKADGVFSPARKTTRNEAGDDLPAIWQQPIDADFEIRCYVFGEEAVFVRLERDAAIIDVRTTNDGRPRASFVAPEPRWNAMMLAAARALGLDYAVIDALPVADRLVILEVNANGVWWFLPDALARPLEARFHAWLEKRVEAAKRERSVRCPVGQSH